MKILFSVLLITTFAIASSVAIQEVLQAEVDAPALDSPGPATVAEGALWNKKKHHHHHHHRKCRDNIDQFFDHDCKDTCTKQRGDCKGKCDLQKGGCKDKCKDSDSRCNLLCDDNSVGLCIQTVGGLLGGATEAIKRDCREVFSCKDKCNDKFEDSQQRGENCDKVCGSDDCTETCISLRDSRGLKSDDPTACEKVCDKCFDKCTDKFKSTVQPTTLLNTFCKNL
ncbi:hypothetical protein BGZ58_003011 [Dissophora ornata]|nr:hypothetical protein BGZ58_003011 [Dissophora ornata]